MLIKLYKEPGIHTTSVLTFPRTTLSMNRRSMLLAATVNNQGATLSTDAKRGPSLPAAFMISNPFSIAWKEPIAIASSLNFIAVLGPIEIDIMSKPWAIASSNAAKILSEWQPSSGPQALYTANLAEGTPPLAVC